MTTTTTKSQGSKRKTKRKDSKEERKKCNFSSYSLRDRTHRMRVPSPAYSTIHSDFARSTHRTFFAPFLLLLFSYALCFDIVCIQVFLLFDFHWFIAKQFFMSPFPWILCSILLYISLFFVIVVVYSIYFLGKSECVCVRYALSEWTSAHNRPTHTHSKCSHISLNRFDRAYIWTRYKTSTVLLPAIHFRWV